MSLQEILNICRAAKAAKQKDAPRHTRDLYMTLVEARIQRVIHESRGNSRNQRRPSVSFPNWKGKA
jgi:hypothetical protein